MDEMDKGLRKLIDEQNLRIVRDGDVKELQHQQRREKYRWHIRAAIGLVSVGLVGALGYGTYCFVEGSTDSNNSAGTDPAMTNVRGLREHGACAAELRSESELKAFAAGKFNNENNRKLTMLAAGRFQAAADLAMKYDVSCTPNDANAESLTPDFDVDALRASHECADDLAAKIVDPAGHNDQNQHVIEVQDKKFELQAGLAMQYGVSC